MLPFLKKDKEASVSIPVDIKKRDPDEESEFDSLESASQDLIDAVHSKDAKAAAIAWRAGFDILDSEPHVEGPHL